MKKPWVICNFLKEMQHGFYVDINPFNDDDSDTKILDNQYKWRGISISKNKLQFNRSKLFKSYVYDLDSNPQGLVTSLYETHPGSMIHYMRVNNVKNISKLFNNLYTEDVEKPFSKQSIYPHLNIICLEITEKPTNELIKQLYDQFDVKFVHESDNSYYFVNDVMSYLL